MKRTAVLVAAGLALLLLTLVVAYLVLLKSRQHRIEESHPKPMPNSTR